MRSALVSLSLLAAGCLAPLNQPRRPTPAAPPLRLALDGLDPWREYIVDGSHYLDRIGVRYVVVPFDSDYDVAFHHAVAPGHYAPDGRWVCQWAGLYRPVEKDVLLDPACIHGAPAFRAIVAHELLHSFGAVHVCIRPGERAHCSPVGYGAAVLNPVLADNTDDDCDPWAEACTGDVPPRTLTALDLAEVRRVRR